MISITTVLRRSPEPLNKHASPSEALSILLLLVFLGASGVNDRFRQEYPQPSELCPGIERNYASIHSHYCTWDKLVQQRCVYWGSMVMTGLCGEFWLLLDKEI
ncbi:hypothetical protein BDZ45DRAFT_243606 [Acephala macrosclerotiorum]|nr:hypothetical protein BDZ45DRAFT_243606 [Acephala macrosclerotiorum]